MSLGGSLGGSLNPDDLQQYVGNVDYPASKEDLASKAEQNGAPQQVVDQIKNLDTDQISSFADLKSSLDIA